MAYCTDKYNGSRSSRHRAMHNQKELRSMNTYKRNSKRSTLLKPRKNKKILNHEKGWKRATVSKPPKKRGRKLAVFAAVLIAGVVLGSAVINHFKLPEHSIPIFNNVISSVDTVALNNADENDLGTYGEDFFVFTEDEAQGIIDAVEEGMQELENEEPVITETPVEDLKVYEGQFELSIEGSTGIVGNKRLSFTDQEGSTVKLDRGQTFTILGISEDGKMFTIQTQDGKIGEVETQDTWINLPDIVPSIIYKASNNDQSLFVSRGQEIPGITGEKLYTDKAGYNSYQYNAKLGMDEYLVPVDFDMAQKIQAAQNSALEQGYSLVIYETFRPMQVQEAVVNGVKQIDTGGQSLVQYLNGNNGTNFGLSWFIAQGTSNHQYAGAMDCSLAKINNTSVGRSGEYRYDYFAEGDYVILEMPTPIHELSADSAVYMQNNISSMSRTAWKNGTLKASFAENEYAQLLQDICTANGLTPLASEWWHFNDIDSLEKQAQRLKGNDVYDVGVITVGNCVSVNDLSKTNEVEQGTTNYNNATRNNIEDSYDRY